MLLTDVEALPGPVELISDAQTPLELVPLIVAGMRFVAQLAALGAAEANRTAPIGLALVRGARADLLENARLMTLVPGLEVPARLVPRARRLDAFELEKRRIERRQHHKAKLDEAEAFFADEFRRTRVHEFRRTRVHDLAGLERVDAHGRELTARSSARTPTLPNPVTPSTAASIT